MFTVFNNDDRQLDKPKAISLRLDDIRSALPEIVRINRLARSSVNNDHTRNNNEHQHLLYLETLTSELFDVFNRVDSASNTDMDMEDVSTADSEGNISLLTVANLGLDSTATIETMSKLNLSEYCARRQALLDQSLGLIHIDSVPETMAGIESTDVQAQIPTTTVLQNTQEAQASTALPVAADLQPSISTSIPLRVPVSQQLVPPSTESFAIPEPTTTTQPTTKPTKRSILADNEIVMATATKPAPSTSPMLADDSVMETDDALKEKIDSLYKDEYITHDLTTTAPTAHKIYTYPKHMIPIFATPEQRAFTDAKLFKGSGFQWKNILSSIIDSLNMPSTFPANPNDKQLSGKLMFLQSLLDGLADADMTLAIVVKGLDEEGILELWMDQLNLPHARFSNVGDDSWAGDYGIFVKTKRVVTDDNRNSQHHSVTLKSMPETTDFILFMDTRSKRRAPLSPFLEKLKSRHGTPTTIAWLITLGCIEEYIFNFLSDLAGDSEENSFDDILKVHIARLKPLMSEPSAWPMMQDNFSETALTQFVADHVVQWMQLNDKSQFDVYQFRTLLELPRAKHTANLLLSASSGGEVAAEPAVTAQQQVLSSEEAAPATVSTDAAMRASPTAISINNEAVSIQAISPALIAGGVPEDNDTQDMDISDSEDMSPRVTVTATEPTVGAEPINRASNIGSPENKLFKILDNEQLFAPFHNDQHIAVYEHLIKESVTGHQLKERLAAEYRALHASYKQKVLELQQASIAKLKETFNAFSQSNTN